jgi:hypothetical protein
MTADTSFHLYLLIGQSNMAGRGQVAAIDREVHPRVLALDSAGQWQPAADPIHFDKPIAGVGPGPTFGKVMAQSNPSVRIGLIPCAVGGSPIAAWQPGCTYHETGSRPYDDAVSRTRLALTRGVLQAILWHQGESDSEPGEAELYEDRLVALVAMLRSDLRQPDSPFVVGTLGDFFVSDNPAARTVNAALRRVPLRVRRAACVEATGLAHGGDGLHFSAQAARELGRRYAQTLLSWESAGAPHPLSP